MAIDYEAMYGDIKQPVQVDATPVNLPNTDDLKELAESAIPTLVRRAIMLASKSNRLSDVMSVLNSMMDRAKGKPHQAVEVTGKITHETLIIQRSQPTLPIIDAKVEEMPTVVDVIV